MEFLITLHYTELAKKFFQVFLYWVLCIFCKMLRKNLNKLLAYPYNVYMLCIQYTYCYCCSLGYFIFVHISFPSLDFSSLVVDCLCGKKKCCEVWSCYDSSVSCWTNMGDVVGRTNSCYTYAHFYSLKQVFVKRIARLILWLSTTIPLTFCLHAKISPWKKKKRKYITEARVLNICSFWVKTPASAYCL